MWLLWAWCWFSGWWGGTAEQVESQRARQQAAELATVELTRRWRAKVPGSQQHADEINREYSLRCRTLGIIGDVGLAPEPAEGRDVPSCNLARRRG